jgi:two-component system, OmpR family, alkaline phosphatase synthesis response regulator PhoP
MTGKSEPVSVTVKKILVVDDEKKIAGIVKAYLEREGYRVITAYDGKTAVELARREMPDLLVLDLMLPQLSGWDVCRELRRDTAIPIIMLSARDEVSDKIVGLELGADDYISKPFDPKEMVSRVRAVLRRSEDTGQTTTFIKVGLLEIDVEKRQVWRQGKTITLTPTEFNLLITLAGNPGRVYSRQQLLDHLQGDTYEGYERTIDSHIKNLRKKLEANPDNPVYIITVHGVGYKLEAE